MIERIISILAPMAIVMLIGFFVTRRYRPDLSHANRLNMDVFTPALLLGTMTGRDFNFIDHLPLALGMFLAITVSGLFGWMLARRVKIPLPTVLLPVMFGNSGNLGIPLAVLTFGDQALQPAVVLFAVSCLFHFSFGIWLLDRSQRVLSLWRVPVVAATLLGLALSLFNIHLWPPLLMGLKMLGEISIPLMLFALGARLADMTRNAWKTGVFGGIARPFIGMLASWLVALMLGLRGQDYALLLIFGAMPPAALNYVFCERFNQEPQRMASIVLVGNLLAAIFLPIALVMTLK